MKFSTSLIAAVAAALASAAPTDLAARQLVGTSENELQIGSCSDYIFIFARGSTEPGNLGMSVGPPTCRGLKRELNDVACQGVGFPYQALLGPNTLPEGTNMISIGEATDMFELANSKCPDSIIVAGGYSQGAAVMVGSIKRLSSDIQAKIAGVVLYGNTRNYEEDGKIPNFPEESVTTYCNIDDGVCGPGPVPVVTPGHLNYLKDVDDAVDFLVSRAQALESGEAPSADATEDDGLFGGLLGGS